MMMESEDRLSFYLIEQDEQVHYTVCTSLASVSLLHQILSAIVTFPLRR